MYTDPTESEFKAFFTRDFIYNASPALGITDTDITNAITEATCNISQSFFPSQEKYTLGCLLLSAHFLTMAVPSLTAGSAAGGYEGITTSKSVGSVSVGLNIPKQFQDNYILAMYGKSSYGMRYLNLIAPYTSCYVFAVGGKTHA